MNREEFNKAISDAESLIEKGVGGDEAKLKAFQFMVETIKMRVLNDIAVALDSIAKDLSR